MKPKFKIGQWVRVMARVRMEVTRTNTPEKYVRTYGLTEPVDGIVVGATHKYTGKLYYGGYDSNSYLEVNDSTLVWKVRTGYLNRPILALEGDLVPIETPKKDVPWKAVDKNASRDMKKMYAEHPEWFPRDAKGRFV